MLISGTLAFFFNMDLLQFGFSLGVFWPPPSAYFYPLTQITKMSKMLFVQWDTHVRLFSLLGDANQHWPWKFSLCEAHEVHNKITRVDAVVLKWCFSPSFSGLKVRGAALSLTDKGLQIPQALLLQQRKWCWVLVWSPTAIIISPLQCPRFLLCPVFNIWIYGGVNQGKTDWYPKSPAAEKWGFLEWWCCLLPVASPKKCHNRSAFM